MSDTPNSTRIPYAMPVSDYRRLPRDAQTWVIKPLIPAGGKALIYGDPKVGKSFAAIQMALAMNGCSTDWFEFPVVTAGNVLYVQLDTPRSLWAQRMDDLAAAGHPVDGLITADRESLDTWPFNILNPVHAARLRATVNYYRPVVVFIDTIRECHQGNENESDQMQKVIAALEAAVRPAALILVAHSRKPSAGPDGIATPDLINDSRGSGYLVGCMDGIIRFSKTSMGFAGRATEGGLIKMQRTSDHFWEPSVDELQAHAQSILRDPNLNSMREKARQLSLRTGRGEEACRTYLRRYGSSLRPDEVEGAAVVGDDEGGGSVVPFIQPG